MQQNSLPAAEAGVTPTPDTNLPVPLTALIGRTEETASACSYLLHPHGRLLTLTGPGGVGKTRLALHIATTLLDDFAGGVYFVPLAPIRDPQFVIPAIARVLDVQESADQPLLERLMVALMGRRLLLVLDNFEQVVSAAPMLASLLETCHLLKLLVTSREVLRVRGEQEFLVPPLTLPNLKGLPTNESLAEVEAVALFVQRAQAVKADFRLTSANAPIVAEICTHLDGLPLALELATARLKLLSPQALLARLESRLQVLTRGTREASERQQTLHNTLQWSYDLLLPHEQRLFRSLAVFIGGWTLDAASAICTTQGKDFIDVEEGLSSLIDKSLVRQLIQPDGEVRFRMFETIREYALDCLEKVGEREAIQDAHAAYYLALAENIALELDGPQQTERLAQLEREYANLRVALNWALEQTGSEPSENELALRLCCALRRFWVVRCYWREGRSFLERALTASRGVPSLARALALWSAAVLTEKLNDYNQARTLATESLDLYRRLGDTPGITRAIYTLGAIAANQSDYPAARLLTEEALTLARGGSDRVRIARALLNLGEIVNVQGEYVRAQSLFEESLKILRSLGNKDDIARALFKSAWALIVSAGDTEKARLHLEESLVLARELDAKDIITPCLIYSGYIALNQDNPSLAYTLLEESLALAKEIGNLRDTVEIYYVLAKVIFIQGDYAAALACSEACLEGARKIGNNDLLACGLERLACIVTAQGEAARAAQLWGAAETLREAMGAPITPLERPFYEQMVDQARTQLGKQAFAVAWDQGKSMSPEQALAPTDAVIFPAQEAQQEPLPLVRPSPVYPSELTTREVEVLRLVAQGLTNAQIAEQLIISSHTVNSHVRSILSKLGLTSRSAIIHFAFEHHLL
ncbi:MAG TPA: tetratricopeptide repeat protein [Ktedonobacteraceae bacterium]|nr:tetratricopeptide repeat protein [Ktedonobacteraceae bacterium]